MNRARRRHAPGFTLFEVMIVIAIIVALTGLVSIALLSRMKRAKLDLAQTDLNTIKSGLKGFFLDFDRYPSDEEGIAVLWDKNVLSSDADTTKWSAQLEEPMINDRWGHHWNYRQQSEHGDETKFDLWSMVPDGQDGTEDDVVSWSKEPTDGGEGAPPPTNGG